MNRYGCPIGKEKGAQIVHTHHVVEVVMGYKDGVYLLDARAKRLLTKIRTRVNQEMNTAGLNINRTTKALVPIVR